MRYLALVFVLSIALPTGASAEGNDRAYPVEILWKLGRGVHNVLRSPSEVPTNMLKEARGAEMAGGNSGSQMVGYFVGTFTGIGYMAARIGTGVFDVVTFPVPSGPIMEPSVPDGALAMLVRDPNIERRPPYDERPAREARHEGEEEAQAPL